jgi:hypothetical protein
MARWIGAAPARQQAGVHVPAAEPRDRQHLARQDQAIGDHHQQVRLVGGQLLLQFGGF